MTTQKWVIIVLDGNGGAKAVGTDGQKLLTEAAAQGKLKLLQKARPEVTFILTEIMPIWEAL